MPEREGDNPRNEIPRWNRGPGGFVRKANSQLDVIEQLIHHAPTRPEQVEIPPVPSQIRFFPALIKGNATKSSGSANVGQEGSVTVVYRWEYELHRAEPSSDAWADDGEGSLTAAALNMNEVNHTAQFSWGVDVTLDDYPAGHRPRPVGGGGSANTHRYDVPVWAWKASDGTYWFQAFGSHDGPCESS